MKTRKLIVAMATPVLAASFFVGLIANGAPQAGGSRLTREALASAERRVDEEQRRLEPTSILAEALNRASREVEIDTIFERSDDWTFIDASSQHKYKATVEGWTVFTMQVNGDTPLQMSIFTLEGRLLATADSEGCGILLNSHGAMDVVVLIENYYRFDNDYILHIY
ncbi:MAG: hypothetical protein L0Y44_00040 [Phycisphaerales bacterium]|nr:hypothetical protein [Phycisphaerales bacterium]MCI0629027.1 hypothetical protein [Phycisphaerales bacterium]MCI0674784.1 hypothetical protein [Phycisphaerales bacterium]